MSRSITLVFFLALLVSMSIATPVASPQEMRTHGGAPLIAISVVQPTLPPPAASQASANPAPAQNGTGNAPPTQPATAPPPATSQGASQDQGTSPAAAAATAKNQTSNA
ncbi:uncharacterized protein MELLADRAFT_66250 [Melampsora larici-populina 98AG31]|uniref:Secreted protein n=1 Tax=Melampsora larici-populina (strain 98AG31 / pathotype 3-4-7) TaxID=747676 RepID=F4RYF6_MELLP|nr:uncharacterized protein MELLADRAFT_66250 [Melampsora larici-populina 98AG31]EGG02461.1 secreted protein [Melampsora larici-populina 98AG31]